MTEMIENRTREFLHRKLTSTAILHVVLTLFSLSLALPFVWTSLDSWTLWASLLLMGFLGTVGHFMMILAYARAPASTLTPFLYAQIGFAVLGGWVAFSHVPDHLSMLGMGMIGFRRFA